MVYFELKLGCFADSMLGLESIVCLSSTYPRARILTIGKKARVMIVM